MSKSKGRLTISKTVDSHRGVYVSLSLRSNVNPRELVCVELSMEDFANAVFCSSVPVEYEQHDLRSGQ